MTDLTQESLLECEEIECNLIDDEDDKDDNNILIILTQVLFKMKLNVKWNSKKKQKKVHRKKKIKKKIASMIMNTTKGYRISEEDVSSDNGTNRILETIDRRSLTKKKKMPNQ